MTYDLTGAGNVTNPLELFQVVNTASENALANGFVLTVFFIMLMILLRNNPPQESFFAASIVSATLCLLLMAAGVLSISWLIGFVLIAALSAVSLYVNR